MLNYRVTNNSCGTHKVCHLLNSEMYKALKGITPESLTKVFGERKVELDEPDSGYTDPEWYFKLPDNQIAGIGFRWGVPRLRGSNLTSKNANKFINDVVKSILDSLDSNIYPDVIE